LGAVIFGQLRPTSFSVSFMVYLYQTSCVIFVNKARIQFWEEVT
jgi:hypothetical protein